MKILSWTDSDLEFESSYNTFAKRLFPWTGISNPGWFGAWVMLQPGEKATAHSHNENEIFFVVSGQGMMRIDGECRRVAFGDTIFIDTGHDHQMINDRDDRLVYLSIWWDPSQSEETKRSGQ